VGASTRRPFRQQPMPQSSLFRPSPPSAIRPPPPRRLSAQPRSLSFLLDSPLQTRMPPEAPSAPVPRSLFSCLTSKTPLLRLAPSWSRSVFLVGTSPCQCPLGLSPPFQVLSITPPVLLGVPLCPGGRPFSPSLLVNPFL